MRAFQFFLEKIALPFRMFPCQMPHRNQVQFLSSHPANKPGSQRDVFISISVVSMLLIVTVFMLNVSGFPDLWNIAGFFFFLPVSRRKQEIEWYHIYYGSNQRSKWSSHTYSFCKLFFCLSIMDSLSLYFDWLRGNSGSISADKY